MTETVRPIGGKRVGEAGHGNAGAVVKEKEK